MPMHRREVLVAAGVGWLLMVVPASLLILADGGSAAGCLLLATGALAASLAWGLPMLGVAHLLRGWAWGVRTAAGFAVAAALVALPLARALASYGEWRGSSPGAAAVLAACAFPVCATLVLLAVQLGLRATPSRLEQRRHA
jgi:hypothetical protein